MARPLSKNQTNIDDRFFHCLSPRKSPVHLRRRALNSVATNANDFVSCDGIFDPLAYASVLPHHRLNLQTAAGLFLFHEPAQTLDFSAERGEKDGLTDAVGKRPLANYQLSNRLRQESYPRQHFQNKQPQVTNEGSHDGHVSESPLPYMGPASLWIEAPSRLKGLLS